MRLFPECLFFMRCLCKLTELVHYKFGYNYGQAFHDYSLNYLSSVNGINSLKDPADTIATDRGAYFGTDITQITLPINDQIPTPLSLPESFTILVWLFPISPGSLLFHRYLSPSNYLYLKIDDPNRAFITRIVQNASDSGDHSHTYLSCNS